MPWLQPTLLDIGAFLLAVVTGPQFWTTLIATFIGATLAFQFGIWRDKIVRRREEKVSGNVAMIVISRQLSDFIQLKRNIVAHRSEVLAEFPESPPWFQMLPVPLPPATSLTLDWKALAFIFDHKGGAAIAGDLINVEMAYADLIHLISMHCSAAQEIQDKLSASGIDPHSVQPVSVVEKAVGFAAVARMNSLVTGIFNHVDHDEPKYVKAMADLNALFLNVFGKKGVLRVEAPKPEEDSRTAGLQQGEKKTAG